jgi:hypothetical protein
MVERQGTDLSRWGKLGIVLAGYALAFIASGAAVSIYDRQFTPADNNAMGGMIAAGGMMFGLGVFLFLSLAPTGLGLWFLRPSRRFWSGFSIVVLGFACAGLISAVAATFTRGASLSPWLQFLGIMGVMQMLSSPLWIGGFLLFSFLAPEHGPRARILVAMGIEVLVAGCAALYFLPGLSI